MPDPTVPTVLLQPDRVIVTVALLRRRIQDRFPDSGLASLCQSLLDVAEKSSQRAEAIGRPNGWIRVGTYAVAITLIAAMAAAIFYIAGHAKADRVTPLDWIQIVEAALNVIIFYAIAIFFLVSVDRRLKRRRALQAIHELRALAHVVDMHQLTKNPERSAAHWEQTENSPARGLSPFELNRYLDYCSEMLSLIGKIAAMYVQRFDDPEALAAVSEVEQLTSGLSQKIWQKIMILENWRKDTEKV